MAKQSVAGTAGFEPAGEGVKVPCLTTWLHPCICREEKARAGAEAPGPYALLVWGG